MGRPVWDEDWTASVVESEVRHIQELLRAMSQHMRGCNGIDEAHQAVVLLWCDLIQGALQRVLWAIEGHMRDHGVDTESLRQLRKTTEPFVSEVLR